MLIKDIPRPVRLVLFALGAIGIFFSVLALSRCSGYCGGEAALLFVSAGVVFAFAPVRRK